MKALPAWLSVRTVERPADVCRIAQEKEPAMGRGQNALYGFVDVLLDPCTLIDYDEQVFSMESLKSFRLVG